MQKQLSCEEDVTLKCRGKRFQIKGCSQDTMILKIDDE